MRKKSIGILIVMLLGYNMNVVAADLAPDVVNDTMEASSEENEGDVLYNVSFPADIHAYLDPGDLSGRGQIFSDRYAVENYGNTDIVVKIKNIDVYCISTESIYEFSEEEIVDNSSQIKKLNINMIWEDEAEQTEKKLYVSEGIYDECVLTLAASEYDENGEFVSLHEGSVGFFYFTGSLNSNPNLVWEDGEIMVRFDYEIVNSESEEEKADTEEIIKPQDITADIENEDNQDHLENTGETINPEAVEEKTSDIAENVKDSESTAGEEGQKSKGELQGVPEVDESKESQEETNKTAGETVISGTDMIETEEGTSSDKVTESDTDINQDEETSNDTEQTDKVTDAKESGMVPEETRQQSADTEKEETPEEPENIENGEEISSTEIKNSREIV